MYISDKVRQSVMILITNQNILSLIPFRILLSCLISHLPLNNSQRGYINSKKHTLLWLPTELSVATDEIPFRIETAVLPQQYPCEMAATKFTADGLLSTEESDPINEDTRMDTKITYEEEDALLSEDRDKDIGFSNDSIPNAQRQERKRDTTNEPKSRQRPSEEKTKEPTGSEDTSNNSRGEEPPKSAKTNGSSDRKRSRHEEEVNSIQEKIESSRAHALSL